MKTFVTNRKILVTGGAGFIGSNLIESLLKEGNSVTCLDNFVTGKRANIAEFLGNPDFNLIDGDIRDLETCRKAVSGVDLVFHEAALGSVPRSVSDPVTTTDVNIGGFVKIIFASKEAGVKRFVYASSSSVYGNSEKLPKREEQTGKALSPYAITKVADEMFATNFSEIFGLEVIGLRYFNVFGRRQDPEGQYAAVIPKFLKMLKEHKPPVINGNGTYSRDFTYIDNVIHMNHLAGLTESPEAINQVYNVAYGERTTLDRMFEIIRDFAGKHDKKILNIIPEYGPEREGDIPHSHASIEKAATLLGYSPTYNVVEGLEETVDWFWNRM